MNKASYKGAFSFVHSFLLQGYILDILEAMKKKTTKAKKADMDSKSMMTKKRVKEMMKPAMKKAMMKGKKMR